MSEVSAGGGSKQRLWVDDAAPARIKKDREGHQVVRLTGFDPAGLADLARFDRIVLVRRNGTAALVERAKEALIAAGVPEEQVNTTTFPEQGVESYRTDDDDLSLADQFLTERQHELRYVADVERWIAWSGVYWRGLYDKTGTAKAKAALQRFLAKVGRERAAAVIREAEEKGEDERKAAYKTALQLEKLFRSAAMLGKVWSHVDVLVQDSDVVTLRQADLNRDPCLLNTPSGLVDLRTGELRTHDPAELCTAVTRVAYDPDAICRSFGWFLSQAQPREENRHYIRRRSGLLAVGSQRTHVFLIDVGLEGRNGKGVLAGILQWVLGSYATTADSSLILVGRNERHPTTIASLVHRRYTWVDEVRASRSMDGARVKQLTGGATRKAYFMKKDEFEYEPTDTLHLTTNYVARFDGADDAFMARVQILPWVVTFRGREDEDLLDRLKTEGEGILAWMVRGAVEYLRDGLQPPEDVKDATEEERKEHDPIGTWLDGRVVSGDVAVDGFQTRWLGSQYQTETGYRPRSDEDFDKVFGRRLAAWLRDRVSRDGWTVEADEWRDPYFGKGRGWRGVRYEP